MWDFPGGPVVKNLPADAGDKSSILGPEGFHVPRDTRHAPQPPSPLCPNYCAHTPYSPSSATGEATAMGGPHTMARK